MRIIHIVGNRPQFIKLALLYKAIAKNPAFEQVVVHTGQHSSYEMSGIFFESLSLPLPTHCLQIDNTDPLFFIPKAIRALKEICLRYRKALFIIYGDTNSTYSAAIAGAETGVTMHHLEAGVRTGNFKMREEINRVIADRFSATHYCCTQLNIENLSKEGFGNGIPATLKLTGDTMYDAFMQIREDTTSLPDEKGYIACTIHRGENIADRETLRQITDALNHIHKQVPVIVPLHPHTCKKISAWNIPVHFKTVNPLDYPKMKGLLLNASGVITDSGGLAREAYFAGKKSLIIMEHPVWPEIIDAGWSLSRTADTLSITEGFEAMSRLAPAATTNIFGSGNAAEKVAGHLETLLSTKS